MIQELLWIPYACFSSKVALLSPPTLYQVRRDQALEKSMIRLLFVGLGCYHIPTNVSGTELQAIQFISRYLQLLFSAFEAVHGEFAFEQQDLTTALERLKKTRFDFKRVIFTQIISRGRLSRLWSIFRRSISVFVLNLCWEEIRRDLVISDLNSGKNRWKI